MYILDLGVAAFSVSHCSMQLQYGPSHKAAV